jgi:hypothetical protein
MSQIAVNLQIKNRGLKSCHARSRASESRCSASTAFVSKRSRTVNAQGQDDKSMHDRLKAPSVLLVLSNVTAYFDQMIC